MIFRFLSLPAQAVRSRLEGVWPLKNSAVRNVDDRYEPGMNGYMRQFENITAFAIVNQWRAGQVGHFRKNSPDEMSAEVVLYVKFIFSISQDFYILIFNFIFRYRANSFDEKGNVPFAKRSINTEIIDSNLARKSENVDQIELGDDMQVCNKLVRVMSFM